MTQSAVSEGRTRANLSGVQRIHQRMTNGFLHLFEGRMWYFELSAGVEMISWVEMFSHPYQAQVVNAANSPAKQCLRGHANFAAASPSGSKSQWEPDVQLVNTRFATLPHHFSAEPPSSPASRRLKKAVQITAGQYSPFPKRWSSEA